MAVLDSSPKPLQRYAEGLAKAEVYVRTFFPSGCCDVPWGRASALEGVAPEALGECMHSCKVFSAELPICEALVSVGFSIISVGLGDLMLVDRRLLTTLGGAGGNVIMHIQEV